MGNILFPMSSLSTVVSHDRDTLLEKLLRRLRSQNKKISDLRIRLLQQQVQSVHNRTQNQRKICRGKYNNCSDNDEEMIARMEKKLEKLLNNKFREYQSQQQQQQQQQPIKDENVERRYNIYNDCNSDEKYNCYDIFSGRTRKSLSRYFNSLNVMKINDWQKNHNTCNYSYHYKQYEDRNPHLRFHALRNNNGSSLVSSDSFSLRSYSY